MIVTGENRSSVLGDKACPSTILSTANHTGTSQWNPKCFEDKLHEKQNGF
jgi:hypothetical protein